MPHPPVGARVCPAASWLLAVALGLLLELEVLEDRKRLCQEYGYEMCMHMCNMIMMDGGYCAMPHAHINKILSSKHMRLTSFLLFRLPGGLRQWWRWAHHMR